MMSTRSYSELLTFPSFEERFHYLEIGGVIGERSFGGNRYLNQRLYQSREWRRLRDSIIVRDNGCDLGVPGYELRWKITIHHLNPISEKDLIDANPCVFDPENLICVSYNTHKALHYGDLELANTGVPIIRKPNDTCPWKES